MSMIVIALLGAVLFTSVLTTGAHAATKPSSSAVKQTTPHTVHPLVSQVSCSFFHAVEIYNSGELCFENAGQLSVNIYGVTFMKDTGNNDHSETYYCNHNYLTTLSSGAHWSGYCSDLTDIFL